MALQDDSRKESISDILRDETITTGDNFQTVTEDIRLAEKEQILNAQKRQKLLEALKESVFKCQSSSESRDGIREEYVRLIRDGVAKDVESVLTRIKKELSILKMKGSLSRKTEEIAKNFLEGAKSFLKRNYY